MDRCVQEQYAVRSQQPGMLREVRLWLVHVLEHVDREQGIE
jgi:hypothetical protein